MRKVFLFSIMFLSFVFIFDSILQPCTVAVVGRRGSPDGRALLWKNRDSDKDESRLVYFKGEKYDFIGLVNSTDADGKDVWAGMNSAGFCIINSASYNLNMELKKKEEEDKTYKRLQDEEGILMKASLSVCGSVSDFEKYLAETSGKRGVDANFGVIDAFGGAAFYETGNDSYKKFDANDPAFAPEGYIVRTNYSFSGKFNDGAGYIRFDRATELFHKQSATGGITFDWILRTASKDMTNSMTGIDPLSEPISLTKDSRKMYYMTDTITRRYAVATILFQSVKDGEDPAATVMWSRLGHPLCGVAVPVWLSSFEKAKLFQGKDSAPLSKLAFILMKKIFPYEGGNRGQYMNIAPLMNQAGDGFLEKLVRLEDDVISEAAAAMKKGVLDKKSRDSLQERLNSQIGSALKAYFPLEAEEAGIK